MQFGSIIYQKVENLDQMIQHILLNLLSEKSIRINDGKEKAMFQTKKKPTKKKPKKKEVEEDEESGSSEEEVVEKPRKSKKEKEPEKTKGSKTPKKKGEKTKKEKTPPKEKEKTPPKVEKLVAEDEQEKPSKPPKESSQEDILSFNNFNETITEVNDGFQAFFRDEPQATQAPPTLPARQQPQQPQQSPSRPIATPTKQSQDIMSLFAPAPRIATNPVPGPYGVPYAHHPMPSGPTYAPPYSTPTPLYPTPTPYPGPGGYPSSSSGGYPTGFNPPIQNLPKKKATTTTDFLSLY